ncbi:MAG: DUF4097 family beta strand repeat-containing protein [Gemmatimonadota bacterium]
MMRARILDLSVTVLPLAAVSVAVAATPAGAQQVERHTLSGDRVDVYDLVGQIDVVPGDGSDVVVEVRRRGRDAGRLRVETGPIDGRETLRVIFPGYDIVYPELGGRVRTTMRVNRDGTFRGGGGWRGEDVEVRRSGGGLEAWADLRILVPAGGRVEVNLGVGGAAVTGVDGAIRVDAASASVSAERTRGALSIDTGSGRVRVRDVQGDLHVGTGSGSIAVSGSRGGDVHLDTGSGSVDATDVTASEVHIDTGSGRITARRVAARNLHLDTGSGSIEVGLLSDVDDMRIDTGSGGVTLSIPDAFAADIEIDTGSGSIDLDVPVRMMEMERSYFRGRIGDGGGQVDIDTGSGSVRVVRG